MRRKEQREKPIISNIVWNKDPRLIGILGAVVLVVILVIVLLWYIGANKSFEPGEATYRYCMGSKLEYEELTLTHTEDATILEAEDKVTSDGTPILYEGQLKMVLPVNMGFMRPFEEDGLCRVNYFSTLTREGGVVKIEHNGIVTEVSDGFLYDGDGTYVFLESMEIRVGEVTYQVQPLSYAKEIYRNCVEIYDVSTGEYQYIGLSDVDAVAQSYSGYEVNLGTGVMTVDGSQRILFADIEAMRALK